MNVALVVLIFSAISAAAVFGYIWRWFNQLKEERRKLSLEEEKRGETLVLGWVSLTTIAIFVGGLEIAAIVAWLGVAARWYLGTRQTSGADLPRSRSVRFRPNPPC